MLRSRTAITAAAGVALMLCASSTLGQSFTNPGFENGFTGGVGNGWTIFGNPSNSTGSDETSTVHSGSHSQKVDFPPAPSHGGIFQTISTTPGQLYKVNFWIYTYAGSESFDEANMETFIGFDSLGRDTYDHQAFVEGADWNVGWIRVSIPRSQRQQWLNFDREFLADSTSATIFIRSHRKVGVGMAMWLDDFSITTASTSTQYSTSGIVPPPTPPTLNGGNMLANPDFENGFTGGVGNSWQGWTATGSGTFGSPNDVSKIGGGHYNGANYMETLSTTATVAFAMPLGILDVIKANDPDILTVGRLYIDEVNFWDCSDAQTIQEGRDHADSCYTEAGYHPTIDAWQGYNEPWVETLERARKVALFEQAFTERLHELGLRSMVLNLAVGTPSENNTPLWESLFAIADFAGYHAYGGPTYGVQVAPDENLFALAWRDVANYYEQNNKRLPPVIYTEGGTYGPWQGTWSKGQIKQEYALFGPKMMEDEWCIGETIFTVGCIGYWCGWDIDDWEIIDYLMQWNQANPAHSRSGKSQRITHDGSGAFNGGIVQAVSTVADGEYWLSGWLKYMTGNGGDPIDPDMAIKIGYDPTGQTSNGNAGTIVWSSDQIASRYLTSHQWHEFGLSVEATGSTTSIWFAIDQGASGTSGRLFLDALDMRAADGTVPPTNNPPTAVASADVTSGDAPLTVNFDGTGSSDPDQDPLTYSWDFDDGSPNGSGSTVQHTFNDPGTYNVVLTVDDGNGGQDTDSVTIEVNAAGSVGILNGDFSDGLNNWTQWTERGSISFANNAGRGHITGNNINGGLWQQFNTGGVGTQIDITGWWESNPTTANNQWAEVLIINGSRTPVNGQDVNDGQGDVEMIYKNDTWATPGGWSGDMDQTAPVANVGTFTADASVATIILKVGNGGGSTNGALFDNIVVVDAGAPAPTISLNKSTLSPSCQQGSNPAPDSFTVSNSGGGTLNYSISDNVTWLSCTPTSGDSTGEADTITVNYTAGTLGVGTHNATITVSDPASTNDPQTIAVTLTVSEPPPLIGLSVATLSPSCNEGSNASNDSFTVANDGGGTLSYSISDNVTWLSCTPTSGDSTGEADTITVTYSTSSLAPGTYNATITVSDPNATNNPQTIAVDLTVNALPATITLNKSTLSPSCDEGSNPANDSFTVQNTGGSTTLNYFISDNQSWLSCSPTSGTSTGEADTITVTYSASGLSAGTYNATITVSDPNATNNPQTIAVTLTVNDVIDITSNLVAWWKLDESSGTTAADSSVLGANHPGTLAGSPTWKPSSGALNGALEFHGGSDEINIPSHSELNGTVTARTVTFWFATTNKDSSTRQVIFEEGGGSRGLNMYIQSGTLYVGGWNIPTESGWTGTWLTTTSIQSNYWHHVALTLSGGTTITSDAIRGYLDGVQFGSGNGSQLWSHAAISIGRSDGSKYHDGGTAAGYPFIGMIDDGRIYNRRLDSAEVDAVFDLGTGGPTGGTTVAEDFNSMPSWSSSFDAGWGSAANWSIDSQGQSGNCLKATRSSGGSSAKASVYTIDPNTNYTISVYMNCGSSSNTYWYECAYKFGNQTAQNFDQDAGSWTMIQKFANDGTNGNGSTWVQYSKSFNSGGNTQITVGYKAGSASGSVPTIKWDTLRIE